MKLSKQQVKHIADLARLELTDQELHQYGQQLSDVLNYINQLQEVEVSGLEPTAQITGLENIMRPDKVETWDNQERLAALKQVPVKENGFIKVKRVIE